MRYIVIALVILFFGLGTETPAQPLKDRSRIEARGGAWMGRATDPAGETQVGGPMGAWTYTHWIRETLAVEATFSGVFADIQAPKNALDFGTNWVMANSFMAGLRKDLSSARIRPFVAADLGFILIYGIHMGFGSYPSGADFAPALHLGGGLDIRLGERWMLGITAGYYGMRTLTKPIGGIDNYSGPTFGLGISRLRG